MHFGETHLPLRRELTRQFGLYRHSVHCWPFLHSFALRSQSAPSSSLTGQVFRKLQCPHCSKAFRLQAALDHHIIAAHTAAPDTSPKRAEERKMVFEKPKFLGTAFNRIEIKSTELRPKAHETSTPTTSDPLGPGLLPDKRVHANVPTFSATVSSWSSLQGSLPAKTSEGDFPDMESVLEMDPFDAKGVRLETSGVELPNAQSIAMETQEMVNEEAEAVSQTPEISMPANPGVETPPNPFKHAIRTDVTNPFAPQPDGSGSFNQFAAELNKKLAIDVLSIKSKEAQAGKNVQFTPFTPKGAFPEGPKAFATQSFVPFAFGKGPEKPQSQAQTMNDTVVSFVQGHGVERVQSASPFKHGMHRQLVPPSSPYAPERAPERPKLILTAEEEVCPPTEAQTTDTSTPLYEPEPQRLPCPRCPKIFKLAEGLVQHMARCHNVELSLREAEELNFIPRGSLPQKDSARQGSTPEGAAVEWTSVEHIRKEFMAAKKKEKDMPFHENRFIAKHYSTVSSVYLMGQATNVTTGVIEGLKFAHFTLTVPFESPPAGEVSSDSFQILVDCTPKKPSNLKMATNVSERSKVAAHRVARLREYIEKQVAEMESYVRSVAQEGKTVYVQGCFRMNPQWVEGRMQYLPVILVTPAAGLISAVNF